MMGKGIIVLIIMVITFYVGLATGIKLQQRAIEKILEGEE